MEDATPGKTPRPAKQKASAIWHRPAMEWREWYAGEWLQNPTGQLLKLGRALAMYKDVGTSPTGQPKVHDPDQEHMHAY